MLDKTEKTAQELVDDWVYEQTGGIVQSGPFTGMWLARETSWPDAVLAPLLLGTYEQELHTDLEREIARLSQMPSCMVANVGCAEGYYAVGLAGRLPNATVHAVDINDECLRIASANAEGNGCTLHFGDDRSQADERGRLDRDGLRGRRGCLPRQRGLPRSGQGAHHRRDS